MAVASAPSAFANRAARDLGNVQAAAKGPGAYDKRVIRRSVYRKTNGALGKMLRSLLK